MPYLFQPTTDIDYRGNLVGITDGTLNQTRTDGVITSWSQVPSTDQLKNITLDTDYTFGAWHEGALDPVTKAYSGLTQK